MKFQLSLLAASLMLGSTAHAALEGFYRQPALRGDTVVFVAEGDLWRAGTAGNAGASARRLTTHQGFETSPAVSPDGQWLAFVGQYDGANPGGLGTSGDVYLMPVSGGVPKRLTWDQAGVRVWGFSAQGEVLVTAPTVSGQPGTQLYAIDTKTAQRRALPVGQASDGALSADGRTLYFTRQGLKSDNARQYRGGNVARLWTLDLSGKAEARPFVAEGANDQRPMPYRDAAGKARVAFLSDRDGTVNVWSADERGQDLRQHSRLKGWDIRHASIDGTRVVYAVGADLHLLDLASNADQKLSLSLDGDFDQQRERFVKKPQDFLKHVALAPNGERVLLSSRGHLATQGTGALRRAELPLPTGSTAGRCRQGEFSSDSKSVFAFCDFSGEVEIWRFNANGTGKPEQITRDASTQRTALEPSPDGRHIAHLDKDGRLWLTEIASKTTRRIDSAVIGSGAQDIRWSPDGSALAFVRSARVAERQQLFLYTLADQRLHQLSSERYDSAAPAFTPDGKWLYFLSDRHFATTGRSSPWGDRNMGPYFDRSTRIYALALQPGLRFPFTPKDELETPEPEAKKEDAKKEDAKKEEPKKDETKKDEKKDEKKAEDKKPPAKPAIVAEGLAQRLFEVPLPPGNYSELQADAKRLWFIETDIIGSDRKPTLKSLAIDKLGDKPEVFSADVRKFALSADGKKLMVQRAPSPAATPEILVVDAAPKPPAELGKFTVSWSDWQIATEPKAEWQQMFADAWRMHRDHFYDKGMHGVDWKAVRTKYEPLVARVTDRAELGELLGQMSSELGLLHSQVVMPELRGGVEAPGLAGLGAQFTRVPGEGFRIERIYASDPELVSDRAPLAAPGLGLQAGDVITAVNGRSAAEVSNLSELLRGQAGRQVLIQAKTAANGVVQRIVTPVPVARENVLRYGDWRFTRAQEADKASQGRIGYLHLRAMTGPDIADFARDFYAQIDREGLIIDVRYNNGGSIDSWILEKLSRRVWGYWQGRSPEGAPPFSNMQQTFRGKVVVLMNEETYSDGETFAEGFKRLGLGLTIGKTTSGAGVWLSDQNRLLDNGMARAAESGQFSLDGSRWTIEGVGVKPDIEVDNPPRATAEGRDLQLEAAIAQLKKQMAEQPMPVPKAPAAYPRPYAPKQ